MEMCMPCSIPCQVVERANDSLNKVKVVKSRLMAALNTCNGLLIRNDKTLLSILHPCLSSSCFPIRDPFDGIPEEIIAVPRLTQVLP